MCFRPPSAQKPQKCPKCNTINPGTSKVCKNCGADLSNESKKTTKE